MSPVLIGSAGFVLLLVLLLLRIRELQVNAPLFGLRAGVIIEHELVCIHLKLCRLSFVDQLVDLFVAQLFDFFFFDFLLQSSK